jgi:hypothetical protein
MTTRTRLTSRLPPLPALTSVAEIVESVRGVTRWPLIFRSAMVVFAVTAAALAAVGVSSPVVVLVVALLVLVLALAGALVPDSPVPLVVQLALVAEVVAIRGSEPSGWLTDGFALVGVACLAYLHHASGAMAAALPWQAVPRASALAAFARRAGWVLGATLGVGVLVLAVTGGVHDRGPAVLAFVGLVLAAAVGLLPALLLRRLP